MSRTELAAALGGSPSAVSNYESGQNALREDVLLRLFHVLDVDPNYLYQDALMGKVFACSAEERTLIQRYRALSITGRQALRSVRPARAEANTRTPR